MTMSDIQASAGVSKHLSALATSYINSDELYACEKVCIPLHQTGLVTGSFQRNQGGWSQLTSDTRAKGAPAMQLDDEDESLIKFSIEDHANKIFVSDRDLILRAQAGISRDQVMQDTVKRCVGNILINREKKMADMIGNSSNYNSNCYGTVSNYWTSASGTPVNDVLAAIKAIRGGACKGGVPHMVADIGIWLTLLGQKQIRDAIGGISMASDIEAVGKILHVKPVVCSATYDNGSPMLGNKAVVFIAPENADVFAESDPCSWRLVHNTAAPVVVKTYTKEDYEGVFVEAKANYALIQPYGDGDGKQNAAYLLQGLTA